MAARACGRLLAALCLLAGCGAPRAFRAEPGLYDRVPSAWAGDLRAARLAFERGEVPAAFNLVAPLALERPRVVPVRVFLQEIELALAVKAAAEGVAAEPEAPDPRATLAARYEKEAEVQAAAEGYVLAARLARSGEEALALLDEADTIDPRCIWVHYGRAWWNYQLRRFREAREALRVALRLDGGHLPSLRLHATLLAGAGDYDEAAAALEVWLERTADDPLFAAVERADALLDLAALEILVGEPRAALDRLEELDPRAVRDPVRAEEVRAAAHEARGELTQALEAVRRASAERPDALLPLVQQALLYASAGDVEGERRTWLHLLEVIEGRGSEPGGADLASIDFDAALFRLQARTRLARLGGGVEP